MNDTTYLIYIISFVVGSIVGLVLSYRKYSAPYVTKNIDGVALIISIIGWMLALNSQFIMFIPLLISITVGIFLIAMVIGMRPGYGRYETVIGFAFAAVVWIIGTVLL
jgi:energy-converting hydrogenase A subunit L